MNSSSLPFFQTYILPAIPFRRRFSSDTSTSTTTSANSTPATSPASNSTPFTPKPPPFLSTKPRSTIACSRCHADIALTSQIISKGFTGRHGRAYLVSATDPTNLPPPSNQLPGSAHSASQHTGNGPTRPQSHSNSALWSSFTGSSTTLPNTNTHKAVPRHLVTGLHTVSDVSCAMCNAILGWKYVGAEEEAQRYKVGKFILETRRTIVDTCWEDCGNQEDDMEKSGGMSRRHIDDEEIMFDSQDEDECEELFAGVWNPQVARRRRLRRFCLRS